MRRKCDTDGIVLHVRRKNDSLYELLRTDDLITAHDGMNLRRVTGGGAIENGLELLPAGRLNDQFEEKPIKPRLWQRIGALLLDRILRRHNEERLFELVPPAGD